MSPDIKIEEGRKMTRSEILVYLSSKKDEFEKQFGITALALFGSYSRDEATPQSDIDILFEIRQDVKFSLFKYLQFRSLLEEALHDKVDLVREAALKDTLKRHVYKDAIYV